MSINSLHDYSFRNPTLRKIREIYHEYEHEAEIVKKSWNNKIRDFLRDKMGVKLINEKGEAIPVPVRIKASFDKSLLEIIENHYPDLDFDLYFSLRQFVDGAKKVQPSFTYLLAANAIQYSIDYAEKLLKDYPFESLKNDLFSFLKENFNKDVFGCYFIRQHEIEIYLLPCILFSKLFNLNLQNFITIILTHELSHAYNHVGYDKDNLNWDVFHKTDAALADGLAQYYAFTFIENVSEYNPLLLDTFYILLEQQPDAYKRYENWMKENSYEAVFRSFIEMRRRKLHRIGDFEDLLLDSKDRLAVGLNLH
jgi:hypothetical protein